MNMREDEGQQSVEEESVVMFVGSEVGSDM